MLKFEILILLINKFSIVIKILGQRLINDKKYMKINKKLLKNNKKIPMQHIKDHANIFKN